ncbi:MAG: hypothetical protein JRI96_15685 [Deltaproteobacteria bacterium]|nr:hypothetical protein [Deltaproteobacteria bacterium]
MQVYVSKDQDHLRLLAIFYYIGSGFFAFNAVGALAYLIIGIIALVAPERILAQSCEIPPQYIGWTIIVLMAVLLLFLGTIAFCLGYAGRCLVRRKKYIFCMVIAGLCCLGFPFGTILATFTFIVLLKPGVKETFTVRGS